MVKFPAGLLSHRSCIRCEKEARNEYLLEAVMPNTEER